MGDLSQKRLIVTGATGYIGSRLCDIAREQGAELIVLGRRPSVQDGLKFIPFELGQDLDPEIFSNIDAVIHLAAAGLDDESAQDLNIVGSKKLIAAAKAAGIKNFVYISSQSAKADAPTKYGRNKWAVEQFFSSEYGTILRPGFVYGGEERGTYGSLCGLLKTFPVLPIIGADEPVQPIYLDTLCEAILAASLLPSAKGQTFDLGASVPLRFEAFLKRLAAAKYSRRAHIMKIPLSLALALAGLCRILPGLPNISSDRLQGLQNISVMETADDMAALGLGFVALEQPLFEEGGEAPSRLQDEGAVLLNYIIGKRPSAALVDRYAAAHLAIGDYRALVLPAMVKRLPGLLRFMDPIKKNGDEPGLLADRLEIAARLAEASPDHVGQFMNLRRRSLISVGLTLIYVGVIEVLTFPFRALFSRSDL
ncbi:MAG: NAD-dependent epimerase/dehydratase family protein [Rhodospirillaceae bacterium]|nr:NAD-dependent epimerase/dehydratase family protein [Rhodospirillaceae bacterium]MBT7266697.1 NAD-dependent epimerase/dehydratase family protein [Rhodospirillaceae bacterium]